MRGVSQWHSQSRGPGLLFMLDFAVHVVFPIAGSGDVSGRSGWRETNAESRYFCRLQPLPAGHTFGLLPVGRQPRTNGPGQHLVFATNLQFPSQNVCRFADAPPNTLQEVRAIGKHGLARFRRLSESPHILRRPSVRICYSELFCSADLRIRIFVSELKCTESLSSWWQNLR
jgi:hypothetical protein